MHPGQIIESLFDLYLTDEYAGDYYARLSALRALYEGYSTATKENKEILNHLLTAHANYCKQQRITDFQRKHNTFVLRYVAGRSVKEIARHSSVSTGTVHRDISVVFENLMVLTFGVYGQFPLEWVSQSEVTAQHPLAIQEEPLYSVTISDRMEA